MTMIKTNGRLQRWDNEKDDWVDAIELERNGNLTYVEDEKTGACDWLAPHELRKQ